MNLLINVTDSFKENFQLTVVLGHIKMCGALRDLVPFVHFKKREKQPRRSVFYTVQMVPNCAKHHNAIIPLINFIQLL